jgi:glycosyltransferase involved in cell wall biosynthesis
MRILWVCPFFPYPPNIGSRIREYNLIANLSSRHDITLFSLIQSPTEREYVDEMRGYCSSVVAVLPESQLPGAIDGRRRAENVLLGIVDKRPHHFYGCGSANVSRLLHGLIEQNAFDALLVDTLFMSNYLWDALPQNGVTTVLMQHNAETLIQAQQFQTARSLPEKLRKWLYYKSFIGFERRACQLYDYVVVVSEPERRYSIELFPRIEPGKFVVIPNGVDVSFCSFAGSDVEADSLIYPGALTYDANLDAMTYFLTDIWPIVQEKRPNARLRITGKTEGVDLSRLPLNNGVTLTGYLDDVRPAIAQSWACVVPLRWGGGTRLKILEAMALGTPVVATGKGAEGLDVTPGQNILMADEPAEFADVLLHLLTDAALRAKLSANGQRLVQERYSWETCARQLEQLLEQVVKQGAKVN